MSFEINSIDRHSTLWRELNMHCAQRIAALHVKLEGDLNPIDTAKVRGQIAEIRALLNLAKDRPVIAPDT